MSTVQIDASETYGGVFDAFKSIYSDHVETRTPKTDCSDKRDPDKVCWIAKNIWLNPDAPGKHDVQVAAWHGEAWVSQTSRLAGVWFCMGIEFKDVFDMVLPLVSPEAFAAEANKLEDFRISLGSAMRSSAQYTPLYVGRSTGEADYDLVFRHIRSIQANSGLPRPHLQVYTKIGRWVDDANTVPVLAEKMLDAEQRMAGLLRLVTGAYPKGDSR